MGTFNKVDTPMKRKRFHSVTIKLRKKGIKLKHKEKSLMLL